MMTPDEFEALNTVPLEGLIAQLWPVAKIVNNGSGWRGYKLADQHFQISVLAHPGSADGWMAWDHREGGTRVNSRGDSHGRGAMSLVRAVEGCGVSEALARLQWLNPQVMEDLQAQPKQTPPVPRPFTFPCVTFNGAQAWTVIRRYLVQQRGLPEPIVRSAWQDHQIYVGWGAKSGGYLLFPQRAWDQQGQGVQGRAPVGCAWRWAGDPVPANKLKVRQSGPRPGSQAHGLIVNDSRTTGWWQFGQGQEAVIAVESAIDGLAFLAAAGLEGRRVTIVAGHGQGGFCSRAWKGFPLVGVATDRDVAGEGYGEEIARQTREPVIRIRPPEGSKDWAEAWQRHPDEAAQVACLGLGQLFRYQQQDQAWER